MGLSGLAAVVAGLSRGGDDDDVSDCDGGVAACLLQQGGRGFTARPGSAGP